MSTVPHPEYGDAMECLRVRTESKRGQRLSQEEHALCDRVYREFPDWYSRTQPLVNRDAAPFGSREFPCGVGWDGSDVNDEIQSGGGQP